MKFSSASLAETLLNPLVTARFSPCGDRVITGYADGSARIFEAEGGAQSAVLHGHQDRISAACFSPCGKLALTASYDATARLWDVSEGSLSHCLDHTGRLVAACFSPDGMAILTIAEHEAGMWGRSGGSGWERTLTITPNRPHRFVTGGLSPCGRMLVTGSSGSRAKVWCAQTGEPLLSVESNVGSRLGTFSFSPTDPAMIVLPGLHGDAGVWRIGERGKRQPAERTARLSAHGDHAHINPPAHPPAVTCATFSPCGSNIVTTSSDGTSFISDVVTGSPARQLHRHHSAALFVQFSPQHETLVTTSTDGYAILHDTSRTVTTPLRAGSPVTSADFSANGSKMVFASERAAHLFCMSTGNLCQLRAENDDSLQIRVSAQTALAALSPDTDHTVIADSAGHIDVIGEIAVDVEDLAGHLMPGMLRRVDSLRVKGVATLTGVPGKCGRLAISGSEITDLSGLGPVQIEHGLWLEDLPSLSSLNGIDALPAATPPLRIVIRNCPNLGGDLQALAARNSLTILGEIPQGLTIVDAILNNDRSHINFSLGDRSTEDIIDKYQGQGPQLRPALIAALGRN